MLVELLGGWTGQLSLAIFTPDLELSVAHKYIQFLSHCYPNLHQQVCTLHTVHFTPYTVHYEVYTVLLLYNVYTVH